MTAASLSQSAIPALVRIGAIAMPAYVLDVTLSGIRLGMDFCLATGADVTVSFQRTVAVGKIRYCRLDNDDSFQAALQIEDVLNMA